MDFPMKPYLVRVHATLGDKIIFEGRRPTGYFQSLGVTASNADTLVTHIREFVTEDTGGHVLEVDDVVVADLDHAHRSIRDLCSDTQRPGVWYVSGRAFYNDDEQQSENDE